MADDAPEKTNPNEDVLAAIALLSNKFNKEFPPLDSRFKSLEQSPGVQGGGGGILQRPPSLPFLRGSIVPDLAANLVTTTTSTPSILRQQQLPWFQESSHGTPGLHDPSQLAAWILVSSISVIQALKFDVLQGPPCCRYHRCASIPQTGISHIQWQR